VDIDALIDALQDACPADDSEAETLPSAEALPFNETVFAVLRGCVPQVVSVLVDRFDVYHLSTITGQETEDGIELLYHFWDGQGLTLRVQLPGDDPVIETLTDRIPGASFYEREVAEMLGVTFEGHPDPKPLFLSEDWEKGPPLRGDT
jgi:membrane-bound hydrogenase subunit beta